VQEEDVFGKQVTLTMSLASTVEGRATSQRDAATMHAHAAAGRDTALTTAGPSRGQQRWGAMRCEEAEGMDGEQGTVEAEVAEHCET
jgi:hypothetical protein